MSKIYFDAEMGAAGDMIAAALADLFDNPEEAVEQFNEAIKGSGLEDVVAEIAKRFSQGVSGEEFSVNVDEESLDYPHEHFDHHHDHDDWHYDHRDHHHFDDHHDHWHHPHFDDHHEHEFHDHHDHSHPHYDDHLHDNHWDSPHFDGHHPHDHHRHYEHPRFEDHRHEPHHPHREGKCCHEGFRRACPPRGKCLHRKLPFIEAPECPIELHFHLHLGDTFVEKKKCHKHRKHHHHHHRHHCHHKHRDGSKRDKVKREPVLEAKKDKKVQNKKTISMSHPKDHLDA